MPEVDSNSGVPGDIISTLIFLHALTVFPPYYLEGEFIRFVVHAPGACESLFGDEKTVATQNALRAYGFSLDKRIDCRDRTEDRSDTIIYHYTYKYLHSDLNAPFLEDYEKAEFFKCDVLADYGIIPPRQKGIVTPVNTGGKRRKRLNESV